MFLPQECRHLCTHTGQQVPCPTKPLYNPAFGVGWGGQDDITVSLRPGPMAQHLPTFITPRFTHLRRRLSQPPLTTLQKLPVLTGNNILGLGCLDGRCSQATTRWGGRCCRGAKHINGSKGFPTSLQPADLPTSTVSLETAGDRHRVPLGLHTEIGRDQAERLLGT